MTGITILPKPPKKRVPKPATMVVNTEEYIYEGTRVSYHAEETFWEAWEKQHFDLGLMLSFSKYVPQRKNNETFKITDGKNVIIGKRIHESKGVLLGGYVLKNIYTEKWAKEKGYLWISHRQVRTNMDHKRHFIKRYRERGFDLSLVSLFIIKAPMAKLGQRIKIIGENDIIIGTRTTEYGSVLISGMKRGEIDFEDYVDYKI